MPPKLLLRFSTLINGDIEIHVGRVRQPLIGINLTGRNQDCTGRWGVGENPSHRDPAKAAQYEVLRPRRNDRRMLTIAETHARFKAECFYRPSRDGRVFLHHFPALRTGPLSLSPFGTGLHRRILSS